MLRSVIGRCNLLHDTNVAKERVCTFSSYLPSNLKKKRKRKKEAAAAAEALVSIY
jgi:hypothetical protein